MTGLQCICAQNPGLTNSLLYHGLHKIMFKKNPHFMVVKKNNYPDRHENTLATAEKANAGLGRSPTPLIVCIAASSE